MAGIGKARVQTFVGQVEDILRASVPAPQLDVAMARLCDAAQAKPPPFLGTPLPSAFAKARKKETCDSSIRESTRKSSIKPFLFLATRGGSGGIRGAYLRSGTVCYGQPLLVEKGRGE